MLTALDRLPQTLCHHDTFRRNLFARWDLQGREQTVAIDWADVGIGAIGEDLAIFVGMDALFLEIDVADLSHLDQLAFASYLAGLHTAGWMGSPQLVRLGYAAAAILRCGFATIQYLPTILDAKQHASTEQLLGHSLEEVAAHWIPIHHFLLRLAKEAQQLIGE